MSESNKPARQEDISIEQVRSYLWDRCNWGRWGDDDQKGAINLIDAQKRIRAASLVRTGRMVSLSRDVPTTGSDSNPRPAQHLLWTMPTDGKSEVGGAADYYGMAYHGYQTTHLDALCHLWGEHGMWGGRQGRVEVRPDGSRWCGVEQLRDGIVTRGVFLDVPRFRGDVHVAADQPVHGSELQEVAAFEGVRLEPGDALIVYSGREPLERTNPSWNPYKDPHPGLSVSFLPFVRDNDVALLAWDLMDVQPLEHFWPIMPHAVLYAYGVPLIDNCRLEPLADACAEEGRYEFMLSVAPLPVIGGTGSPVNPIALF